ncbi:MAG: universal stress protein [Halovenus sp.]
MALLIAYDGSAPSENAVEHAIAEHPDKEIILLHVVEVPGGATSASFGLLKEEIKDARGEPKDRISSEIRNRLKEAGIDFQIEIAFGQPAREIVNFAEENDIEHILIGNHGRSGVSRVLLGSVAEKVVRRAPMPVTVVR